tara:strand:+ start:1672 stop:2145 length:474 start_codon:yes stop_codon:yes gene_type:complete
MDTLKLSLVFTISLFLSACGAKKDSKTKTESVIEFTENDEENPIQIISPCLAAEENPRLEFETNTAYITEFKQEGNCIVLTYNYSGCKPGRAHLAVTEKIPGKKSLHLKLELLMENAGECDMLITDSKHFSLQNIAADQDLSLDFNTGNLIVEYKKP